MPPPPTTAAAAQAALQRKKKGHAPAHQNTFAFKHNAKSKKTEKILSSPNIHVCRRCHDKIEWRKRYRKYKPRTQPGVCNACQQRNVLTAYHTICTSCTIHSAKAQQVLQAYLPAVATVVTTTTTAEVASDDPQQQQQQHAQQPHVMSNPIDDAIMSNNVVVESTETAVAAAVANTKNSKRRYHRVCAICVKEPALLLDDDADQDANAADVDESRRIRLRQRKTIERNLERQEREAKQAAKEARRKARLEQEGGGDDNSNDSDDEDDDEMKEDGDDNDSKDEIMEEDDAVGDAEDDDPFLKAVGGADKLLVGEAYQQKLLEKKRSESNTTS